MTFEDPNRTYEDVEKATKEVRRAIEDINTAETAIAEDTGLTGQTLTDATDEYLIDRAERAIETDTPDMPTTVETVLVEGALEMTGDRPLGTINPIIQLENDGNDRAVTEGVRRLYNEGATLPDGESAAEVVATTITSHNTLTREVTRPTISDELDTALQYYIKGSSKEDIEQFVGIDPKEVTKYIRDLPDDEREYLVGIRRKALGEQVQTEPQPSAQELQNAFVYGISEDSTITQSQIETWYNSLSTDEQEYFTAGKKEMDQEAENIKHTEAIVEQNLEASAPELLKGRLPKELADRIGSEYVIGLRQLGIYEVSDAQEGLDIDGGVNVANLGLVQSFNVIKNGDNSWTTEGTVIRGYYGVRGGGKYVIAVPLHEASDPTTAYDFTPDMRQKLRTSTNPNHRAVNPKYVAGFIDGEGMFHPNENFMRSNEAMLSGESTSAPSQAEVVESIEATNPYEKLTPEQLITVRDNIADSIVEGFRTYNLAEVSRASANLAAIQREIIARSGEQPAHQRGEVVGAVTYITEPDKELITKIAMRLLKLEGASDIARAMNGGFNVSMSDIEDEETRLNILETHSLLSTLSKEIRKITGSEFGSTNNPHTTKTNEELVTVVNRLKQAIQEGTAQGRDTTNFRKSLALAGKVIKNRS